jgi:hypothetical protein
MPSRPVARPMDNGRAINYKAQQCLQAQTRWCWQERENRPDRGCSSGVEHNLAKVGVVGSNPIARSKSLNALDDQGSGLQNSLSAECPRNLFAARSDQNALSTQDTSEFRKKSGDDRPVPTGAPTAPKKGVRERSASLATHRDYQDRLVHPAHPSNRLIAQLNANWRVIENPLQWILQRRKGNPRGKNSGWENRSYCATREALLRCIRENCCYAGSRQIGSIDQYRGVDEAALGEVNALPESHIDWECAPGVDPCDGAPAFALATHEMLR